MAREPPNTAGLIQGRPPYLKNITHTHTHTHTHTYKQYTFIGKISKAKPPNVSCDRKQTFLFL